MQTVAGGRGITPGSCHGPVAVRGHQEPSVGLSRSLPLIAVPPVSVCWGRGCASPQGSLGTQKSQGCCARSGAGQLQEETGHPQACGIILWACKQSTYPLNSCLRNPESLCLAFPYSPLQTTAPRCWLPQLPGVRPSCSLLMRKVHFLEREPASRTCKHSIL